MPTNFPTSLDTLTNPATTDPTTAPSHAGQHANANDALEAVEAKLGTGASTPSTNTLLRGTGAGASAYGQLANGDVPSNTVAPAKLAISATDRLVGRDTASAGAGEELTVGNGLEFTGSGGIQRSALTGEVTASAGSNATTVAATHSGSSHAGVVSTHEAAADPHAGYVLESLLDAKGDLIVATADNTPAKLTAGADYSRLWTRAGATAGMEYGERYYCATMAADHQATANSTALANVNGATLVLPAGLTVLTFDFEGFYQSNTATNGINLTVNAGGGTLWLWKRILTAVTPTYFEAAVTALDGAGSPTTAVDVINVDRYFRLYGKITSPTGTLAMRFANEVAVAGNQVTVKAGSVLKVWMA